MENETCGDGAGACSRARACAERGGGRGTEEEEDNEGGKHDEECERDGDDEEEGGDEEGADDEGGAEPEVSTTLWRPCVLCPQMKAWKGKGKATEKGKGKE